MRPRSPIGRIAPPLLVTAGLAATAIAVGVPAFATSERHGPPAAAAATAVSSVAAFEQPWPGLPTPEARGLAVGRLVSADLQGTGVPEPQIEVADIGAALGQFDSRTWTLRLSRSALDALRPVPSSPEARALVATAHHEVRHAEQWFRMAQLRAAEGRSADAIVAEMAIPRAVAAAAAGRPLADDAAAEARQWWTSVYGAGVEHRNQVLTAVLSAKAAYDEAARTYRTSPSSTTGAALLHADEALAPAYAAYRALPEEADAFAAQAEYEDRAVQAAGR